MHIRDHSLKEKNCLRILFISIDKSELSFKGLYISVQNNECGIVTRKVCFLLAHNLSYNKWMESYRKLKKDQWMRWTWDRANKIRKERPLKYEQKNNVYNSL